MDIEIYKAQQRPAFTLVELLVVIGIIAVLIGILVPVLTGVQTQAREMICRNNLRQLGGASMIYASMNNGYLPWDGYREGNKNTHNVGNWNQPDVWFNAMLTSAGGRPYYQLQEDDMAGVAPLPTARSKCLLSCPDAPSAAPGDLAKDFVVNGCFLMWGLDPVTLAQTQRKTYMCYGYNTQLDSGVEDRKTGYPVRIRLNALRQESLTVLLTEKMMSGAETTPASTQSLAKQEVSVSAFAARHRGGGHILFCDGHVDWMSRAAALAYPDTTGANINIPWQLIWDPAK